MRILFSLIFSLIFLPCFPNNYNNAYRDLFLNKKILILGGTGYLGRAIVSELLNYSPAEIRIFSRDEVKHFNFSKQFGQHKIIKNIIGDIRNYDSLAKSTKGIDIVFHAAALKRIDILENNVEESIRTNIIGSLNVFKASVANGVKKVLFISTDKACLPVNTYGASKFISEKIFTNYDYSLSETTFSIVRYGNVLESTGSVIPIFIEKIRNEAIIPLTSAQMTRFIITKQEAVKLIFDAIKYGVGGDIFVQNLPAMKIIDLIDVLKKRYNAQNQVKIIGIRPGEKMHELLVNKSEIARTYQFDDKFVITPNTTDWMENLAKKETIPTYIKAGQKLQNSEAEFSSDAAVISQKDLKYYLDRFWFRRKGL